MTDVNHHRIGRQVLELDIVSASRASELQEQAALPFRQGAPEIEALFDGVAGPGELLRLERLEIDLGELHGPEWREQLVSRLVAQLSRSLARETSPTAESGSESPEDTGSELRGSPDEAPFAQFLFFLAHGRLPWWGRKPTRPWAEAPPASREAAQWRSLDDLLRRDRRARARLAVTVDDAFLDSTVTRLAGLEGTTAVMRSLAPLPPGTPDGIQLRWRHRFWRDLLDLAVDPRPPAVRAPEVLELLIEAAESLLPPREAPPAGRRRTGDGSASPPADLPQPWRNWLETARRGLGEAAPAEDAAPPAHGPTESARGRPRAEAGPEPQAPEPPPDSPQSPGDEHRSPEALAATTERTDFEPPARPDPVVPVPSDPQDAPWPEPENDVRPPEPLRPAAATDTIYVEGAGVVILHPFLAELFASRDLIEKASFRDEEARGRAVQLLARLTFGDAGVPEYDLLVPKLLCAMPWEDPLTPRELTGEELQACDELLGAVLGHWSALRSASPEWLRQEFFLRDGKLEAVDGGWKLTVERRAQDLLLTRLPWGLGAIRLPWMTEMLHVNWAE